MTQAGARSDPVTVDCRKCPLRRLPVFEALSEAEVAFMRGFKAGELTVAPQTTILLQGSTSPQLFTALRGWGLRYKLLPDGERQVINFVMPGDLVGLQAGLLGEMQHCVESVTDMTLCVFPRSGVMELFKSMPARAYDVTWLAAREEHFLGDMLATVGQRSGVQRVAWGLLTYWRRAAALVACPGGAVPMPYRQQDLADAFGLSLVHTNKTLKKLRAAGQIVLENGTLAIPDPARLQALANMDAPVERRRPLI
jgi:CRP/FNR family transcriptional regulator